MNVEVSKKDVKIVLKTKHDKATSVVIGNPEELSMNNTNKIEITITTEDETKKVYILNITRKLEQSNVEIKEFKVNDTTKLIIIMITIFLVFPVSIGVVVFNIIKTKKEKKEIKKYCIT